MDEILTTTYRGYEIKPLEDGPGLGVFSHKGTICLVRVSTSWCAVIWIDEYLSP